MVENGRYTCPVCHRRLIKVLPNSVLCNTPVYCKKCKVEWFPSIYMGKELEDDEPFPILEP